MASEVLPAWRKFATTLVLLGVTGLAVVLLVRALPIPDSPFFLGVAMAAVYWLMKRYVIDGEG